MWYSSGWLWALQTQRPQGLGPICSPTDFSLCVTTFMWAGSPHVVPQTCRLWSKPSAFQNHGNSTNYQTPLRGKNCLPTGRGSLIPFFFFIRAPWYDIIICYFFFLFWILPILSLVLKALPPLNKTVFNSDDTNSVHLPLLWFISRAPGGFWKNH